MRIAPWVDGAQWVTIVSGAVAWVVRGRRQDKTAERHSDADAGKLEAEGDSAIANAAQLISAAAAGAVKILEGRLAEITREADALRTEVAEQRERIDALEVAANGRDDQLAAWQRWAELVRQWADGVRQALYEATGREAPELPDPPHEEAPS